jgi:transcriptional regulator with XRE-family HTH domain
MSIFDYYQQGQTREKYRSFLALPKGRYKHQLGFNQEGSKGKRYPEEAMRQLEALVNEKAARAESTDTTPGERYRIARDYQGLSDAQVAREMGVSRELARRWGADLNRIVDLPKLATLLDAPEAWLQYGGEASLPADSHIGVRVGDEARGCRETLYGMTSAMLADLPEDATEDDLRVYIEQAIFSKPWLAKAARQAGGRWQGAGGMLMFAPWVPLEDHGLTRRSWSDEVEDIINEELSTKHSTYAAWHALKARCEPKGLEYPKLISLHKRVEKERERAERYGVDINELVNVSQAKSRGH